MNDSFNSNDTGGQNPIFNIMREEDLKQNLMVPLPPLNSNNDNNDNYLIKQNYRNEIDNMFFSLKEFNNNIMQMMISTNRMIQIINENTFDKINIRFLYRNKDCWVNCKLKDKMSDVINKIKINEDGFNLNNKIFIFNAKRLELNQNVRELGLNNNSVVFIIENRSI